MAQAGQRELARQQFCQVIFYSENIIEHQIAAAVELSALGFGSEAIEILHRALIKFNDNFFVYSNLGVEYAQLGEFSEAVFCHQKALEMNSFNGDLWYNLACTYALNKEFAKSLQALGRAIHFDANNKDYALEDEELADLRQNMGFWRLLAQFEK